jgi:hypothetical protein
VVRDSLSMILEIKSSEIHSITRYSYQGPISLPLIPLDLQEISLNYLIYIINKVLNIFKKYLF